jgi:hypothetical protein
MKDAVNIIAMLIGLVIASGLSASLVIAVFGLVYHDRTLAPAGAEIVSAAVVAMATALGVIVGRHLP